MARHIKMTKPELTIKAVEWHRMTEVTRQKLAELCEITVDPHWTEEAFIMHEKHPPIEPKKR